MATLGQSVLVVIAAVVGSLLFMALLNRLWPCEQRRPYIDLIGWQLGILATTYAVILGFMLYAVWTSLVEASLNVDLEANAVVELYRLAKELPEPQRTQLHSLARSYADTVVDRDWPQMDANQVPEQSSAISGLMADTVTAVHAASPPEITAHQLALEQLSSLDEHRLTRISQSTTSLPTVLWWVLLVGGVLTITAACTLGAGNRMLQALQVLSFSLLISLALVAIADIHRPFHGSVRVPSDAFHRAQQSMQAR